MIFVLCKNTFFFQNYFWRRTTTIFWRHSKRSHAFHRFCTVQTSRCIFLKSQHSVLFTRLSAVCLHLFFKRKIFPKRWCFHEILFTSFKIQFKFSTDKHWRWFSKKMHSSNPIYTCYRFFFNYKFSMDILKQKRNWMLFEVTTYNSLLKRNLCRTNYPILAFQ